VLLGFFFHRIRQGETSLRASEARFRDLALTLGDWIWEVDHEGRYTYVSDSVETMLGYPPHSLLGRSAFEIMPPDEAVRLRALFEASKVRPVPVHDLENRCLHQNGSERVLLTNCVPILCDKTGDLLGYRGADKDITEAKRLADELARYQHQLEDMVSRRTADLESANQRLRNSDIRLKTLFKLSQRAGGMSLAELLQAGLDQAVRLTHCH
jgi:PAS domain S-box-containing protein